MHRCVLRRCTGVATPDHLLSRYVIPNDQGKLRPAPISLQLRSGERDTFDNKIVLDSFPQHMIRNVSVVAHVDHGKTTLTDALLRYAGLLPADASTGTFTDRLAVEKERGITIKAQTCSVILRRTNGVTGKDDEYLLNLIDTPGHVDFQYEVSRSLSASEGAALLVDVQQGVEAQTMAHFYAALENNLTLIPVLTKMDNVLTDDQVEKALQQLEDSTGLLRRETVLTSAKAKAGIEALLTAMIDRVPPPTGVAGFSDLKQLPLMHPSSDDRKRAEEALVPLRALLFDCWTLESSGMHTSPGPSSSQAGVARREEGKGSFPAAVIGGSLATPHPNGVYCLVRVVDGSVTPGTVITFAHTRKKYAVREVGIIHPILYPLPVLTTGMVGYLFFADLQKRDILIGDTLCTVPSRRFRLMSHCSDDITASAAGGLEGSKEEWTGEQVITDHNVIHPIPGFKHVQPVVFAGFYPDEGEYITQLRKAVDLLCINDPSVTVDPIQCQALGAGLQLGFLGLLHMQVFKERLLVELGQTVLVTPSQVQYMYVGHNESIDDVHKHKKLTVSNWLWPHEGAGVYLEPIVHATVVTPKEYFTAINGAALTTFRGEQEEMRIIDDARMLVRYRMPLADLARGFFQTVKSSSHGYATLDYDDPVYVAADLVKVDVVINKSRIAGLSLICPRSEAAIQGRRIVGVLKENLNRSSVDLPLQAMVGSKIVARETVKAYRKDVTAKIHAGDISRKQKKWNDQKKGKERMARRTVGTVTLDQSVLAAAMGATTM